MQKNDAEIDLFLAFLVWKITWKSIWRFFVVKYPCFRQICGYYEVIFYYIDSNKKKAVEI